MCLVVSTLLSHYFHHLHHQCYHLRQQLIVITLVGWLVGSFVRYAGFDFSKL